MSKRLQNLALQPSQCRMQSIVKAYGITGTRESFEDYTLHAITNIKKFAGTRIPVEVKFVISTHPHISLMDSACADAIMMGSAIIKNVKCFTNKKKCFRDYGIL
jgi:tryptophan synthase alpha subunit